MERSPYIAYAFGSHLSLSKQRGWWLGASRRVPTRLCPARYRLKAGIGFSLLMPRFQRFDHIPNS